MKRLSLTNGTDWLCNIEDLKVNEERINELWVPLVIFMRDDIREKVHAELAPCTHLEFLIRYLELCKNDLIIG